MNSAAVGTVLVGAGAVDHRDALVRFAERAGVAVLNTERAKGTFAWDDPHHGGTVGLQARDLMLAGVLDAAGGVRPGVVVCGLADDELVELDRDRCLEIAPADLDDLATHWPPALPAEVVRPPLYDRIASVVGPAYADGASPPARAAVVAERAAVAGAVVVAGGDLAGFWIGRSLPTPGPGMVDLGPEPVAERIAAHRQEARPVIVVHSGEVGPARRGDDAGVDVVRWQPEDLVGPLLDSLVTVAGPISPRFRS